MSFEKYLVDAFKDRVFKKFISAVFSEIYTPNVLAWFGSMLHTFPRQCIRAFRNVVNLDNTFDGSHSHRFFCFFFAMQTFKISLRVL